MKILPLPFPARRILDAKTIIIVRMPVELKSTPPCTLHSQTITAIMNRSLALIQFVEDSCLHYYLIDKQIAIPTSFDALT